MYFVNITTIEELRKAYKQLAKRLHPDNGGNAEDFKAMNAEYDKAFSRISSGKEGKAFSLDIDEALRAAIDSIINLDGIEIEICGIWIWVSGNTYKVKEELKKAGFKWCSNKKLWAFHAEPFVKFGRRKTSMEYIRSVYGSEKVERDSFKKLK